jgi:hypothetical protein
MPRRLTCWTWFLILACCYCACGAVSISADEPISSEELLPADKQIPAVIDHYLARCWTEAGIEPAPLVDDLAFFRRLSLDLAGRIPTPAEVDDYLQLPAGTRRHQAIEAFLELPDFAFHLANEIDVLLLARLRKDNDWRAFLLEATRENRSWDRLFTEVLTPDIEHPDQAGPAAFLKQRIRDIDDLTNDTAVLFFGVNIGCAKCHDHPLVTDWEQDHYYGMAAFFKRTYQTKKNMLAEDFEGLVKFTNILGEEKQASFKFLSNAVAIEPELTLEEEQRKQLVEAVQQAKRSEEATPPEVSFRPRSELVRLALKDQEQDFFTRNIVNRVWARLLGLGLVMPLDQMHSQNPPSHPELLDWLVRDTRTHGFDLKRLIAGIVQSEAYARSARWERESERPAAETFAVGMVRPLNPRQLSLSLQIASLHPERLPGLQKPDDWEQQRQDLENRAQGFADLFPIPEEGFQVGTDEALLFSNSNRFANDFLRNSGDRLVGHLVGLESSSAVVQQAFLSVLSRLPTAGEHEQVQGYLEQKQTDDTTDRAETLAQIVWALLASPEFRFNH